MGPFKVILQELQLKNFGFNFEEPSYFVRPQWPWCGSYSFVLYRLAIAGYFVIWLIWTCIREAILQHQQIFIYFTTWVAMVTAVHGIFAAMATFYHHVVRTRPGRRGSRISRDVDFPMSVSTEPITLTPDANGEVTQVNVITGVTIVTPWYIQVTWFFYDISLGSCAALSILYWPLVYDGNMTDTKLGNNAINTLIFLLDLLISRVPVRISHVIYPVLFFIAYLAFNVLYCLYGSTFPQPQRFIYSVLDWHRPMLPSAGACVIVVLLYPMIYSGWYLLYQLRLYLWRRYGQAGC